MQKQETVVVVVAAAVIALAHLVAVEEAAAAEAGNPLGVIFSGSDSELSLLKTFLLTSKKLTPIIVL